MQKKQWTKEQAPAATKSLVRPNAQNREAKTDRYLPERYGLFATNDFTVFGKIRQPIIDFYFGKTIFCDPILPEITIIGALEYTTIVTILPGESISGSIS